MDSEPKSPDEVEVDRLLGDRALIKLNDLQPLGGPSRQKLHRAIHSGLIKLIKVGKSSAISRATAKRILLEGLPPIEFVYGKQAEKKKKGANPEIASAQRDSLFGFGAFRHSDCCLATSVLQASELRNKS